MRQDELDLIKALAATPLLNGRSPAMASVAKAVDEDDSGRVPGHSWDEERRTAGKGGHFCMMIVCVERQSNKKLFSGAAMALWVD